VNKGNIILLEEGIQNAIISLADDIRTSISALDKVVFVGVVSRGVPLAQRIANKIKEYTSFSVPVGQIDVSLYRDDLVFKGNKLELKETKLPFDINDKILILVDDVIFHGRTIRAALDGIHAYGRPQSIKLAVLIDRGYREFPIQPDFTGKVIQTSKIESIKVKLSETDGEDAVYSIKM